MGHELNEDLGSPESLWPKSFNEDRSPPEKETFLESRLRINPTDNHLLTFLRDYDENTAEEEVITNFCASVHRSALTNSRANHLRQAWLDDRRWHSISSSTSRGKEIQDEEATVSKVVQPSKLWETTIDMVSKDIVDEPRSEISQPQNDKHVSRREYDLPLDAPGLCRHLKQKYTTYDIFELYFYVPLLTLSTSDNESKPLEDQAGAFQSQSIDISSVINGHSQPSRGTSQVLHVGHVAINICGVANRRWTGYAFVDGDEEMNEDDFFDYNTMVQDQFAANGDVDANHPTWDPREYFLLITSIRVEQVIRTWSLIIQKLETSHQEDTFGYSLDDAGDEDTTMNFRRTQKSVKVLGVLHDILSETNRCWADFSAPDGDISYFEHTDGLSITSRTQRKRCLMDLKSKFRKMRALQRRLETLELRCQRAVDSLERRLAVESNRANKSSGAHAKLMVAWISPVAILVSIQSKRPFMMTTFGIAELESSLATLHLAAPSSVSESADTLINPLDVCRSLLADILSGFVESGPEAAYKSIQWPNNIYNGDLSVVLPKLRPGCKAVELAADIASKFPQNHPLFPLPFLDGVHFRIFLEVDAFARILFPFILNRGRDYGTDVTPGLRKTSSPDEGHKKLVVEFSSPNTTNELHGRHLRSTIIGAFIGNFYESMGWDVTRINYLGDWGKNIALLKVGWERFGNEEAYQASPIEHLLNVYEQINSLFQPEVAASRRARDEAAKTGQDEGQAQAEIEGQGIYAERNATFKKLEDGDEEAVTFWKRIRDINIEKCTDFYSQLGIRFDEYTGESQVSTETMLEVENLLKDKNICEESSGAWVVHMQNYGLKAGTAIIRNRDGATTYLLRDLAAMIERSRKYSFDKMIIVTANDHNALHFTHLIHILAAIDMKDLADKIQHMKFNETSNMADTVGKGYEPQAIISHVETAMAAALEADEEKKTFFGNPNKSAKTLSIASLLVHELSTRTTSAHSFDTTAMTTFKLGTGPDLQYWYAKLCAVLKTRDGDTQLSDEDYKFLAEDESAANLLRLLAQYPEVIRATYNSISPQSDDIIKYLAGVTEQLADTLSSDEDDDAEGREQGEFEAEGEAEAEEKTFGPGYITLFEATRIVLENGLKMLGITPYATESYERADTPIAD
ncbi:hypothetical protein SLS60_009500 [Paraconiothyrium brasiliense]|uniref:arginine--tRNA ligase n=1 Tax=Paraconiothyrium brasiliense TaxID=300254 RepID=A0ABR3QUG0_9PLEO